MQTQLISEIRVISGRIRRLNLVERLREVVDDVVDMLRTDTQADGGRRDVLFGQFLGRQL